MTFERRKVAVEGDDWTWTGNVFQTIAAANRKRATASGCQTIWRKWFNRCQ